MFEQCADTIVPMQDVFTDTDIPPIDFDAVDVASPVHDSSSMLAHVGVEEVMSPVGGVRSAELGSDDEMSDVAGLCPSLKTYHSGSDCD